MPDIISVSASASRQVPAAQLRTGLMTARHEGRPSYHYEDEAIY
jgi:hypothetical protein